MRRILLFGLGVTAVLLRAQTPSNVLVLEPFKVTGSRAKTGDDTAVTPVDRFTSADVEDSGAFDAGEFLSQLPPSPNGKEQLVLIDGHPTFLNPADLPPDLVESIEVARYGAMPQYGAFANGNVINIRLKKDYRSRSIGFNFRDSFAGGGEQEGATLSGATTQGKFRAVYTLAAQQSFGLRALDRPFSAEQNHTAFGGEDLRLLWGSPPVIEAVTGPLTGVRNAQGQPVSVALVPVEFIGEPSPGDFTAGQADSSGAVPAAGQRRFNTAPYIYLQTPSTSWNLNFELSYTFSPRLLLAVSGRFGRSVAEGSAPPPVTPVSAATLVPAAYNPFGQDVEVGLVHTGFGPVRSQARTENAAMGLDLFGPLAGSWSWAADLGITNSDTTQFLRDLDEAKFSAALTAADPAQRFNPFWDAPASLALYPALSVLRSSESRVTAATAEISVHGDLFQIPGGPVLLYLKGNGGDTASERSRTHAVGLADATLRDQATRAGGTLNINLPLVGQPNARPGLYRLTADFSSHFTEGTDSSTDFEQRIGLAWSPTKRLAFRAGATFGVLGPTRYIAQDQPLLTETLVDPRRLPATAEGVEIISHDFNGTQSTHTDQEVIGLTATPAVAKGLEISLNYDRQHRGNVSGRPFNAEDLIENEAVLPRRVIRADPTVSDQFLGQPGAITAVDITPIEGGELATSGVSLATVYKIQDEHFGRFSITTTIRHNLTSRYEFPSGLPFTSVTESQFTPPAWTTQGEISWSGGGWNAVTHLRYSNEVQRGTLIIPGTTDVDLQIGYRFRQAIFGKWGKGLHAAVGFGGLFEGPPPFADTIEGFRGGSPLGRTYSCRLTVPL